MLTYPSKKSKLQAGMAMPNFSLKIKNKNFEFYKDMDPKYFYILCFDAKKPNISNLPIITLDATNIQNSKLKWPKKGFIIIRPDTYIALITKSDIQVSNYFNKVFSSL
jgi:hypothetical protein